ncbi:MAG TPA: hypothetical protein VGM79_25025 [Streptosporangiaceae bacterium]
MPSRLRALAPWLRSLSSRLEARPFPARSRLGSLRFMRSLSLESVLRDAGRRARRPSRLTLGVAAGTVVAAAAVLAVVSGGSGSTAAAVSDQDQDTVRVPAPSVSASHGAPDGTGSAAEAPVSGHAAATQPARHASASPSRAARSRAASRDLARRAAPAKPYLIYDSVVPGSIPASQDTVATYSDGPHPTPASEVAGRKSVLWISITGHDYQASVVDVEPGNATPAAAANWAWHRLSASPHAVARIYTMISEWPAVKSAVASFPAQMQSRIHWWIANPTGVAHMVPGADATQWYWGSKYDITTAAPGF